MFKPLRRQENTIASNSDDIELNQMIQERIERNKKLLMEHQQFLDKSKGAFSHVTEDSENELADMMNKRAQKNAEYLKNAEHLKSKSPGI